MYFPIEAPVRIGVIFKHLRQLLDLLLERKLANPKLSLEGKSHVLLHWLGPGMKWLCV